MKADLIRWSQTHEIDFLKYFLPLECVQRKIKAWKPDNVVQCYWGYLQSLSQRQKWFRNHNLGELIEICSVGIEHPPEVRLVKHETKAGQRYFVTWYGEEEREVQHRGDA